MTKKLIYICMLLMVLLQMKENNNVNKKNHIITTFKILCAEMLNSIRAKSSREIFYKKIKILYKSSLPALLTRITHLILPFILNTKVVFH